MTSPIRSTPRSAASGVAFDADRGLCLVADRGAITTYKTVIFDQHFHTLFSVALAGLPSRARVSHDGRYGATTTFVFGDSYAGTNYSTRTELYDLRSGKRLGDLEQFTTLRNGQAIDSDRSQPVGSDLRPDRQQPLLRNGEARAGSTTSSKATSPPDGWSCCAPGSSAPRSLPTGRRSPSRRATPVPWAGSSGGSRCSISRRSRIIPWPRPGASTTRPSGSTTTPSSTPSPGPRRARRPTTPGRCRPTAAAIRRSTWRGGTRPWWWGVTG